MPITLACPHCSATLSAPRKKAGLTLPCPRCGRDFVVPTPTPASPPPVAPLVGSVSTPPPVRRPPPQGQTPTPPPASNPWGVAGSVLDDYARRAAAATGSPASPPPPPPRRAPSPRAEPTGLRCYDCGGDILEGELVRRDVSVGGSSWYSNWSGGPSGHGSSSRWSRVDLCAGCSRARDERARLAVIVAACSVGFIILFTLCMGVLRH